MKKEFPCHILAKIDIYCYMVQTGKPAACIAIQARYMGEAIQEVDREGLQAYVEILAEGWNTLWIYKKDFMLDVIKRLPDKPETVYEHWILGKVFGYSEEAIEEFVKNLKLQEVKK